MSGKRAIVQLESSVACSTAAPPALLSVCRLYCAAFNPIVVTIWIFQVQADEMLDCRFS